MSTYYILNDQKEVIPCSDIRTWGEMFKDTSRRVVASTKVGGIHVSTVFLGLDHNYLEEGPPLVFETLVFGGDMSEEMERYSTWAEAEEGHLRMLEKVINK